MLIETDSKFENDYINDATGNEENPIPIGLVMSSDKGGAQENDDDGDEEIHKNEKHSKVSSDEIKMEES